MTHFLGWGIVGLLVFNIVQTEIYLRRSKRNLAEFRRHTEEFTKALKVDRAERERTEGRTAWAGLQAGPTPNPDAQTQWWSGAQAEGGDPQ